MFRTLFKIMFVITLFITGFILALWFKGHEVVKPVKWQPAPNPGLVGDYAPNTKLDKLSISSLSTGVGAEDIAYDGVKYYYTGLEDGRILKFNQDNDFTEFVNTEGRPLGMQFDVDQNLIVADAAKGLLSISPSGEITILTDSVNGKKMKFVDDLDIAEDGTIWFSDASQRFGFNETMRDFIEASMTGRLLSYSPATQKTKVEIDGLFFANGVALSPNDGFVLVNETGTGRIHRKWLKGANKGKTDYFVNALPGSPDNISFNGVDTFWVAIAAKRDPKVDGMAKNTFLRTVVAGLPLEMLKTSEPQAFIVGLDLNGNVKHNFQTQKNVYSSITSVNQYANKLFIGSLHNDSYAIFDLDED